MSAFWKVNIIPWIKNKPRKYYIPKVVAGTVQLTKLSFIIFYLH